MRSAVRFVLLTEAFSVLTYALGWWTVPIVGAAWALLSGDRNRAAMAGLAAGAGWILLLLLDAVKGPIGLISARLGGVMGVPPILLWLATPMFAGGLAWSAAKLVTYFGRESAPTAAST
ncbi:MAG: hypothetical protein ABIS03_11655 [Gemmatimonadaceae bacterium]